MQIFVKGLTGTTYTVEVEATDTIKTVRTKLLNAVIARDGDSALLEKHIMSVRLVFAGRQLDDEGTLESRNVSKESTLHMSIRFGSKSLDDRIEVAKQKVEESEEELNELLKEKAENESEIERFNNSKNVISSTANIVTPKATIDLKVAASIITFALLVGIGTGCGIGFGV
jgi:hypothetical protein